MTLRRPFAITLVVFINAMDFLSAAMIFSLLPWALSFEVNGLYVRAWQTAGVVGLLLLKLALTGVMVALLMRVRTRNLWPATLLCYFISLAGFASNVATVHLIAETVAK